jgi:putative transposase
MVTDVEVALRDRLRQISAAHPRWGWRKAHAIAAREGLVVNRKRTRRLWIELGLKRPARVRKKQRCGPARHQRLRAHQPDQMWAPDFQVDLTVDGRQARFLNIVDEYTREALATQAARSFTADATVAVLDRLVTELGRRPQMCGWTTGRN